MWHTFNLFATCELSAHGNIKRWWELERQSDSDSFRSADIDFNSVIHEFVAMLVAYLHQAKKIKKQSKNQRISDKYQKNILLSLLLSLLSGVNRPQPC